MNKQVLLTCTLFVLLVLVVFSKGWAQSNGTVVITSPSDGATVHGSIIELDLKVGKGTQGDSVHLYVDGRFEAIVKGDRYLFKGLPAGSHRIDAKLATRKHEELGPSASVTFTVQ